MDLSGKTALVTGGALRIGRAICLRLAKEGVNVVVHYCSSESEAKRLTGELKKMGVESRAIQADFRDGGSCEDLVKQAKSRLGGLDMLVNSASVFHKDTFQTLAAEKLRDELQVNLEAPLLLMKAFGEECGRGNIVNLLDERVAGDDTSCVPYILSKKSLADATRLAALFYAPRIAVNAIAPGNVLPPNIEGGNQTEPARKAPLDEGPTPEDIADAVIYLAKTDPVTGQILYIDAGAHLS